MNPFDTARERAEDVDVPGPWHHERDPLGTPGGGLVLYDVSGEPIALIYAGLPVARYLEAVAPATLFDWRAR